MVEVLFRGASTTKKFEEGVSFHVDSIGNLVVKDSSSNRLVICASGTWVFSEVKKNG